MLATAQLSNLAEGGEAMRLRDDGRFAAEALEPIRTLDLQHLAEVEPAPKAFVIPNFAPAGEVTLFTGPGSAGKSLLAQQLATALAAGVSTLGLEMGQGSAIYLTCEDGEDALHWRQAHICKALDVQMARLAGALHLASLRGALDNTLLVEGSEGHALTPAYDRLAALIRRTEAKLVALDNLAHIFTGNENDRAEVTRFVNMLSRLASESGAAVLLLGHPNKSGDTYSGSTAWLNAVRSQVALSHDEDTDIRTLTVGKANYGRKGEQLRFAWCDWAFVLEGELPEDTAAQLRETARAQSENAAFLACLRARAAQGEGRLVGPSPGANYAPAQFEAMPEAKGLDRKRLRAAMERLFLTGEIETFTYHNQAKSRSVTLIREAARTPARTLPEPIPNASRTRPDSRPNFPRTHSLSLERGSGGL